MRLWGYVRGVGYSTRLPNNQSDPCNQPCALQSRATTGIRHFLAPASQPSTPSTHLLHDVAVVPHAVQQQPATHRHLRRLPTPTTATGTAATLGAAAGPPAGKRCVERGLAQAVGAVHVARPNGLILDAGAVQGLRAEGGGGAGGSQREWEVVVLETLRRAGAGAAQKQRPHKSAMSVRPLTHTAVAAKEQELASSTRRTSFNRTPTPGVTSAPLKVAFSISTPPASTN